MYDSGSYVGGSRLIFGLDGGYNFQSRITKPVALLIPGLLELTFGLHPRHGFFLQALFSFFACLYFLYAFYKRLFSDTAFAEVSLVAYTLCSSLFTFSLLLLTDMFGWFFIALSLYLGLQFVQEKKSGWHFALLGAILGIGFMAKESVVFGGIVLFFFILFGEFDFRRKINYLLTTGIGFLIPTAALMYWIDAQYGISIISRLEQANDFTGGSKAMDPVKFVKNIFRVLDFYWLPFGIGIFSYFTKGWYKDATRFQNALLFAACLSFVLVPLVWPHIVDRISFLTAAGLVPFIALGTYRLNKTYGLIYVIFIGLCNLVFTKILLDLYPRIWAIAVGVVALIASILFYYETFVEKKRAQSLG